MAISTHSHGNIPYVVRGSDPKLLILSGTHGDEYEVTEHVTAYLDSNQAKLPDYIYIPEASPSAVQLKTRRNKYGHDLNREFLDDPVDPEVIANMYIINPYLFDLCIAFHEDPDRSVSYYMYDSEVLTDAQLKAYRDGILSTGAKLYTGIDDPADKKLSLHVEKGYISTPIIGDRETGFSMRWLIEHKKARRVFNPEIPGRADQHLKKQLVAAVFQFCLTFI